MSEMYSCHMILPVSSVMTHNPRSIEVSQPLCVARKWMDELGVRHLPVRQGGKLVGIISDRDLNLVLGVKEHHGGEKSDVDDLTIEDAMISEVHEVLGSAQVKDAARLMLDRKIGSLLVKDDKGQLSGIFTETDALKILAGRA